NEPGPERADRVVALGLDPFAGPALLQAPLRDVVADAIAGDIGERLGLRYVLRPRADDHRELDLVVHALEALGLKHRVSGTGDAGACLGEHDRHLGNRHAGLLGVIAIVQPDTEEFRHHPDRWADAGCALDQRQRRDVEGLETIQAFPSERSTGQVAYQSGEIADLAACVEQAGSFAPGLAIP